jgi:hypothetical protein
MSVSRAHIDADLEAAEHALEAATERRQVAEHGLWQTVSRSGKKDFPTERVDEARAELAEAERVLGESERLVAELRRKQVYAKEREDRLLAITDMLMARDDARRGKGNGGGVDSPRPKPARKRSFLDRLRGR